MPPDQAGLSRRAVVVGLLLLAVAAAAVVISGLASRRSQAAQLRERADAQAVPTVSVITPRAGSSLATLDLPGRIEAQSRAPIYARVSGYLKAWHADIGSPVKAGQLLAEIDTPELDQQLLQAQAELATARAGVALATSTARRWQSLLATDAVSRQEADEKAADLASRQSVVNGLQANVERIVALKRFARITAPFAGVVTARNTDLGALVNVGGAPGSELFVVSDVSRLRIYVGVPQVYVGAIRVGAPVRLSVPESPGKVYPATVQALSQAIASGSGSMLVQLAADNRLAGQTGQGGQGGLLPGGFVQASFDLPAAVGTLSIPPGALLLGKAGPRVAVVNADGVVQLKPVTIARDLGASIDIGAGLSATDRVIDSPPDGLDNGDRVRVAEKPPARAAGQGSAPATSASAPASGPTRAVGPNAAAAARGAP